MAADKHDHCIVLPYIVIACRPIRFLTLHANGCFSTTGWDRKADGQYLFLGTDVITGLDQSTKNSPRIHARYMKSGLATKLEFPDASLDDIRNCNAVWFYSIQGLFKLVFEHKGLEEQKDCLLKLRDAWMKTLSDPSLPESMTLTWSQYSQFMPTPSSVSLVTIGGNPHPESEDLMAFDHEPTESMQSHFLNEPPSPTSPELSVESILVETEELISAELRVTSRKTCQLCGGPAFGTARPPTQARDVLEGAMCTVQALQNKDGLSAAEEAELGILKLVLDFVHVDLQQQTYKKNCFPLGLLESYVNVVRSRNSEAVDNDFNIPGCRNVALMVICQWLGQELHGMEPMITERMESFKKLHINNIDRLPKAEDVISHLFPQCMRVLVSSWCGFDEPDLTDKLEKGSSSSEQALPDHSYSSNVVGVGAHSEGSHPTQTSRRTLMNAYPIILHILEFACNNLFTGASHVVYALLRVTD